MRWYRGDGHVHSVYSYGGELTHEQLATGARAAGLDFIATTEHNTADAHGRWGPYAGDDLLVILGQEVVTRTGHWLALGIDPGQLVDWRYGVRDDVIDRCLDQVHRAGGMCVAAHPHAPYPSGDFMYPYQGFDVVEVWNGLWTSDRPWNADNQAALAEWGRGLDVRGVPAGTVGFHTDRGKVHRESLPSDGSGAVQWHTSAAESAFVRIEVRHSSGHPAALSNPIILT